MSDPPTHLVGKRYEPWRYEVGREKIREFAAALGHREPWYFERAAARSMGFRDVVAPPMFAVVFCRCMHPGIFDPDLGIDYDQMLHGGQDFVFGEPVCSGDVITTTARVSDVYEKGALTFFVFESSSSNQRGRTVVEGTWTMIVREG